MVHLILLVLFNILTQSLYIKPKDDSHKLLSEKKMLMFKSNLED